MSEDARSALAALGFRVKSGWATAVLLGGSAQSPQLLDRRRIELCDPAVPKSKQPYHARMGILETDERKIEPLRKVVFRCTGQAVKELIDACQGGSHSPHSACLVVGSVVDPARIAGPHIRAHALEGQLFRTALQDGLQACGLRCLVIVERNAYAEAADLLKQPEDDLKQMLTKLGRSSNGPWRADEKLACLAAWLALTSPPK